MRVEREGRLSRINRQLSPLLAAGQFSHPVVLNVCTCLKLTFKVSGGQVQGQICQLDQNQDSVSLMCSEPQAVHYSFESSLVARAVSYNKGENNTQPKSFVVSIVWRSLRKSVCPDLFFYSFIASLCETVFYIAQTLLVLTV